MGEYQFEISMVVSDVITVDADSYDEAESLAHEEAQGYYAVTPAGFSVPWDNVDSYMISEPDEEE
jgi:hypothetical protein